MYEAVTRRFGAAGSPRVALGRALGPMTYAYAFKEIRSDC